MAGLGIAGQTKSAFGNHKPNDLKVTHIQDDPGTRKDQATPRGRVWVVSEVFYPEETSTAHFMTGIASAWARSFETRVLCVQPTYSRRGVRAPWSEEYQGMHIRRCWSTTLDRHRIVARLANMVTIASSITWAALWRIQRGDVAFVVTNPPVLPLLVQIVCLIKGARCVVRIDDIYSEMMVASGMLKRDGFKHRAMLWFSRWSHRRADMIVVLGRDMKELLCRRWRVPPEKVQVVPSWSDSDAIRPMERAGNPLLVRLGLEGKFVVMCAGNLGRVQAVESLVEAATLLRCESHIHFLFIGSGAKRGWILQRQSELGLGNLTLLDPMPRSEQETFLNACDLACTALIEGMLGAAVPSRLYNIMAAGKAVLAIGDPEAEAALVVAEEGIGWTARPSDPKEVADAILAASRDLPGVRTKGERARRLAETKYSSRTILGTYVELMSDLKRRLDGARRG